MAGTLPPATYSTDPTLYLYTSLTAGSSHIITATSRLETILKANKIPFRAIDVATDDKARMTWGMRSKGRKLPGLVRYGAIVGVSTAFTHTHTLSLSLFPSLSTFTFSTPPDLEQIEEWNEYGELKAQIAATLSESDASKSEPQPVAVSPVAALPKTTSSAPHIRIGDTPSRTPSGELQGENMTSALRQASEEAAAKAKDNMRARLGLKPQSPLQKSDEQKPEGQKSEKGKLEEKKSEAKKPEETKLEAKVSEEKKAENKEVGEQKAEKEKPDELKTERQQAKGDNEEKPQEGDEEVVKQAVGSGATQQPTKTEEQPLTKTLPVRGAGGTDEAEVKSTGDSKPEKPKDEGEAKAASSTETKEAKDASGLEKEAA
ncbi:uncharacterized protein GIQ15_04622 [Arthroderma uncinatum]|uniref:uncharacterized protein n=1 Tax=Arthroderma uncinatum TaxID=74035 RepID=UPI00144A73BA|nr:uncharacterized protein GIQ15_04622 [Arthroderma uncinatum]KAF3481863.1 hypothetical protein GIQ15_04622 [Arthroderma uncinatum]